MGAAETSTGTRQGRGREGVLAGADGLDFSQGRWAWGKGEADGGSCQAETGVVMGHGLGGRIGKEVRMVGVARLRPQ